MKGLGLAAAGILSLYAIGFLFVYAMTTGGIGDPPGQAQMRTLHLGVLLSPSPFLSFAWLLRCAPGRGFTRVTLVWAGALAALLLLGVVRLAPLAVSANPNNTSGFWTLFAFPALMSAVTVAAIWKRSRQGQ